VAPLAPAAPVVPAGIPKTSSADVEVPMLVTVGGTPGASGTAETLVRPTGALPALVVGIKYVVTSSIPDDARMNLSSLNRSEFRNGELTFCRLVKNYSPLKPIQTA